MNIGLSNLITVDGIEIKAFWNTFAPSLAVGRTHELCFYSIDVDITRLMDYEADIVGRSEFVGKFSLAETQENVETYSSEYGVKLTCEDGIEQIKSIVFFSDGVAWAICNLEKPVQIKQGVITEFNFVSYMIINNKINLAKDPWYGKIRKFDVRYGVKLTATDLHQGILYTSNGVGLNSNSEDKDIVRAINLSHEHHLPIMNVKDGNIVINIKAVDNKEYNNIKVFFIRILWNMGILVYIDSVIFDGVKLDSLTLVKGQQINFQFGFKFTEIRNQSTL